MTQQRTDEKLTFTIEPRVGMYNGMPESRSYQVVFLTEAQPLSVSINGTETDTWTYDETSQTLTVSVPTTSCDAQTVVEVSRSATDASKITFDNTIDLYYDATADELVASASKKAKNIRLSIASIDGAEAAQTSSSNADRLTYAIGHLPQGGYICRLNVDGQIVTRKIVK